MIMKIGLFAKQVLVATFGTWFYSVARLPVGTHLEYFIKYRVKFPIRTVVDVGANVGKFSSSFYRYFPKAQFFCIEPFTQTFHVLQKEMPHSNFNLFKVAFGEKSDLVKVEVNQIGQSDTNSLRNLSLQENGKATEIIEVITLDDFMSQNQLMQVDFLKIDTEGYDLQVLKGGSHNLNAGKIKLVLVECGLDSRNTYHVYFQDITKFLIDNNFALIGFFQTDIRKISKRNHFSNALFAHDSVLDHIG
ncbi:FkbM family methyltransferase [Algoriphagus aquaeductus]|nr:FkbM family methyltransferase [Algoriphagus aquaeductus]